MSSLWIVECTRHLTCPTEKGLPTAAGCPGKKRHGAYGRMRVTYQMPRHHHHNTFYLGVCHALNFRGCDFLSSYLLNRLPQAWWLPTAIESIITSTMSYGSMPSALVLPGMRCIKISPMPTFLGALP